MSDQERPEFHAEGPPPPEPFIQEVEDNEEFSLAGRLREVVNTRFAQQDISEQIPDRSVDKYVDTLVREWQQRIVLDLEERVALGVESFLEDLARLRGDSTVDARLSAGPETEG